MKSSSEAQITISETSTMGSVEPLSTTMAPGDPAAAAMERVRSSLMAPGGAAEHGEDDLAGFAPNGSSDNDAAPGVVGCSALGEVGGEAQGTSQLSQSTM